jgi:predicted ATPase
VPELPFTGRQRELDVLEGALRRAQDGEGSLLLVTGESGIGKTRLLEEIAERAGGAGWLVAAKHGGFENSRS